MTELITIAEMGQLHGELAKLDFCSPTLDEQAVKSIHVGIGDIARTSTSTQFTIIGAIAAALKARPVERGADRLALAIGRVVGTRLGFLLALDGDDPLFREWSDELRELGLSWPPWFAGRMIPLTTSYLSGQMAFPGFVLAEEPDSGIEISALRDPSEAMPKVYVASALTDLGEKELHEIEETSTAVADAFSGAGYMVHQPAFHTHPARTVGMPHREVHSIDYGHVADGDVLVLLSLFPSFGAGKETAWSDLNGLTVVVVQRTRDRVSRLITGSPGTVRPVTFESLDELGDKMKRVAEAILPRARRHVHARLDREKSLTARWLSLRSSVLAAHPACFHPSRCLITPERNLEIISSPTHFSGATVWELQEIEKCLSYNSAEKLLELAASQTAVLTSEELDGLLAAQAVEGWSDEQTHELALLAMEHLAVSENDRRLRLTSAEDWIAFRRSAGA